MGGMEFNAGTFILTVDDNSGDMADSLAAAAERYGFTAFSTPEFPDVPTHAIGLPRFAVMHTWQSTQNEGWVRMAMDQFGIPYDYISIHEARDNPRLRDKYDVILFGPSRGDALGIVRGLPMTGDPIPWKTSEVAPNIGKQDETDDMRGGLGLEGVVHLRDFVAEGGAFITIQGSSCRVASGRIGSENRTKP